MSQKFLAYHLGVHGPLAPKLNNYFRQNKALLDQVGIFAPAPDLYRPYCRDFIWGKGVFFKQQQEMLELTDCPQNYAGICMSNNQTLSPTDTIWSDGEFLIWAEARAEKLGTIFADHRIIFLLEIENFATFLPRHLMAHNQAEMAGIAQWPIEDFVWSDLIEGIQRACPAAEIVVVPTEGMVRRFEHVVAEITTAALKPRRKSLQKASREQLEAFQLAIGASMGAPLPEELSEELINFMGWDQETRINLSRQYYSEILRLCHTTNLII